MRVKEFIKKYDAIYIFVALTPLFIVMTFLAVPYLIMVKLKNGNI